MCGITGVWTGANEPEEILAQQVERMACALEHRGPDDAGIWTDEQAGLALSARRLAILDLSPAGHQPMLSGSGRFVLAYNGEVYNFLEIRRELEAKGRTFRGHSDTEVLVEAMCEWGVLAAVKRCVGMFAFAAWDREQRRLWLGRDRIGIKPLYYGWVGGDFVFGSELKALRQHPRFDPQVDRRSLTLLMRYTVVPAPYSIYQGVCQLPPGSLLALDSPASRQPEIHPYWSMAEVAVSGQAEPFSGSEAEATDQLETLIADAVRIRLISDVPIGAFLSGGIDSSTVVALMQKQSSRPVKTFTIGFQHLRYNESDYARSLAQHLGTQHTELEVTPSEVLDVLPRMPKIFDEPFADLSQIPTYLVSQLARQQVTVSLSGDGGDELFAGYGHYARLDSIYRRLRQVPAGVRQKVGQLLVGMSDSPYTGWMGGWLPEGGSQAGDSPARKMRKLGQVMGSSSLEELYRWSVSHWRAPTEVVIDGAEAPTIFESTNGWRHNLDAFHRMMFIDTVSYLPNDILTKLDRTSMAVSLEARVPLLDHRVVEFAWKLPLHMKMRAGRGKWILRQVLYRHVPPELVDRPKMGFVLPLEEWLGGALRPWAENLLSEQRLEQDGFFNTRLVRERWAEHLSGKQNWLRSLWNVLMFQAWKEEWL